MNSPDHSRAKLSDLYTEPAAVSPPSDREVALARRAVARVAHDAADLALLLAALGLRTDAGAQPHGTTVDSRA
ncbi:hypothetical protein ACTG9Q_15290 [Actinokineospora sp. 24-640]